MQSIFSNALPRAVAKHIDLSVTRRETLSWLTLLIMQHGTICLWRLAAYVASMAQTDSVRRRFYRFFQFVRLDSTLAARVVRSAPGSRRNSGSFMKAVRRLAKLAHC
jgi:hypothetical protein